MIRSGSTIRAFLLLLALGPLAGCAAMLDPTGVDGEVRALGDNSSEMAMKALSTGDYIKAERLAVSALRLNPKDTQALLVAGMAYQATGRYDLARQYYEVIVTNKPAETVVMLTEGGVMAPRSVVDVANANIAAVDKITGRNVPRTAFHSGRLPPPMAEGPMPAFRPGISALPLDAAPAPSPTAISEAEANVAGRFTIAKRLLDDALMTPEEHAKRRAANIGALLPYTTPPPGVGLERPIPGEPQVVERLRALSAALESRAINDQAYAEERTAILDALLPAAPKRLELPPLPPKDMIEAAQAVGRIERMRAAGLVSADEANREKAAIGKALDTHLGTKQVAGSATGLRHGPPPAAKNGNGNGNGKAAGGGNGVHLASLGSEAAATKAWEDLKKAHPQQLGSLSAVFARVDLGAKGVRWRVVAGPLADEPAARALCKAMKLKRQYCAPMAFSP